jgi:HD-GYP domain-containing protein (c-di-GMP phosphodiesterase class II)
MSNDSLSAQLEKINKELCPLLSVANLFDSLTSDRPYRKAMSPYEVGEILSRGSGTKFGPKAIEAFLRDEMEAPAHVV